MIDDIIRPYPGEDEVSFTKRKAYFYRFVKFRFGCNDFRLNSMLKKGIPINPQEREMIDAMWGKYLPKSLREVLVDYRCYDAYKGLKSSEDDLFKYMPDSFFQAFIDDYFTNPQHSSACDDKNMYDLYFHDIAKPKTLFRKVNHLFLDTNFNEITLNDVIRIARDHHEVICKKAKFSSGGRGILIWNSNQNVDELIDFFQTAEYIVCQEMLTQHVELSRLNPTSVNTLRIFTLLFHGDVYVLSSIVRMGINNSKLDNASQGGLVCGIKSNGQLKDAAWTVLAEKFEKHPQGFDFSSVTIPNYHECISLVKSLAKRMSSVSKLISWDLAINEAGYPVLIECNFTFTGTESLQIPNGPLLGDLTEDVLAEVFGNSYTLKSIIKSFQ